MKDNHLSHLWLAESIRLTELQSGQLEDAEANRNARALKGEMTQKIIERARLLAQRAGLIEAQQRWIQSAKLAGFILVIIALIAGVGMAFTALGDGSHSVNIFWALGSLLGLHLLALFFWLISLWFMPSDTGSVLGRLWLWLTDKLSRNSRAIQLAPALLVLLNRQKAARWGVGAVVHSIWLITLISTLIILLAMLSTKHYSFIWQTTLLNGDTFVALTHSLGALPSLFGFPQPDIETIKASGASALELEIARSTWAGWLIGVFTFYGLLPRLILSLYCLVRWKYACARLSLDLTLPENQLLAEKLQPSSEHIGVIDADGGYSTTTSLIPLTLSAHGHVLVAIEIDDTREWPPVFDDSIQYVGIINDRYQRKELLDKLHMAPAARLLIVCDPLRSPDRGTLHLIADLMNKSAETRIWLLNDQPVSASRLQHWHNALQELNLQEADLHWLRSSDE